MFFSAAQTPPSHHSFAPFHIVFLISLLSLPLYEVFPSPASFFRIPRPRLAHSSCPAKNRNIGLADEQGRSWIQDDEVLHSHFHMPSPSLSSSDRDCDSTRRSLSQKFTLRVTGFGSFHYTGLMLCSSCYPGKLPQECHHSSLLLASLPRSEELTPTIPKPWSDFAIQIIFSVSAASFHARM